MEVKILCPCGAKYKFDVEPLHGKLPGPVNCPVCQADGTVLGNEIIARQLSCNPSPTAVAVAISPTLSRSGFVAPPVVRSSKDLQPSVAAAPQPVASAPIPIATPRLAVPYAGPVAIAAEQERAPVSAAPAQSVRPPKIEAEPSFTRGLFGIAAASFVGLLIWFGITVLLGLKIKWIAIGIGAMIGWAGQALAKEKSVRLGIAAATATALVVLLGLLWSARHEAFQAVNESLDEMWKEQVAYAKGAVQASRSDKDLLAFLQENGTGDLEFSEDEEDVEDFILRASADSSAADDAKELANFRKNELPKLRNIANGKVSKSQFEREHRPMMEAVYTIGYIIGNIFKFKILVFIGIAIGAAWKFTSGQ